MPTLRPGSTIHVRLEKAPRPDLAYTAKVLHDDGDHIVVTALYAGTVDRDLGYVTFELGDCFTEHYWRTRWYSIKEVRRHADLKGWYCDIARPAIIEGDTLRSIDLELDVWIDGQTGDRLRLDEGEFAASALARLDPAAAENALRAFDELAQGRTADLQPILRF